MRLLDENMGSKFDSNIDNYQLSQKEENEIIDYINQLLKEFDNQLNIIYLETTCFSIMPLGNKICETILDLLLKKEGYLIDRTYTKPPEIIKFSYKNNIIPEIYLENLHFIRIKGTQAIHGDEPKYNEYMSFFKKFSEFINWFDEYYLDKTGKKIFIDNITLKISSILKTSNINKNKIMSPNLSKLTHKKYNFDKRDEYLEIHQINEILNDYEKQLKSISSEKIYYYVFQGSTITELMLKLLLQKEKIYGMEEKTSFFQKINSLYEKNLIPKECMNFLHLIRRYRNKFFHGNKPSDKTVISFLNALNYFIQWFDNYYSLNYQSKFEIEGCCALISSLTYNDMTNEFTFVKKDEQDLKINYELKINKFKTKAEITTIKNEINNLKLENNESKFNQEIFFIEEINRLKEELKRKENEYQKKIDELERKKDETSNRFNELVIQFGQSIMSTVNEINERGKRVESKIDNLHTKIDIISNQISTIQSLTEKHINNAQSTEEIERIIETYIDECIKNIMEHSLYFSENQNYQMEKKKLIYSIGEEGWKKLRNKSKTFLITSKVMYNHLITMEDIIDYSGICVLVTKALEVEIQKRFFSDFLDYLYENYGTNYKMYHTALLYRKMEPLKSEKFTMGNIAFVMCHIENRYDDESEKDNNKARLMEYCKECIFSKYDKKEIKKLLNKYASSIEEIRKKYRNPSAHTNKIKRIDAEECFNLVLDIEKLLKQMLDSFDY